MGREFGKRSADAGDEASGNYLRGFKKGDNLVRPLQEEADWVRFWEHYKSKKGFPCTEDRDTCPGCTSEDEEVQKASKKYGSYFYFVKAQKVLPVKIPASLRDRFLTRAERNNGKVTTRDFVVIKTGTGFDTEYDVDSDEKYDMKEPLADLIGKSLCTVQEALNDSWTEVWGSAPEVTKSEAKEHTPGDENPPTEPADQKDTGEQVTELTEADIKAMDLPALQKLCTTAGLRFQDDDTAEDLVDKLLRTFGS